MNLAGFRTKSILAWLGVLGALVVGLFWLAASFLSNLATFVPPSARPSLHP